uniref:Uncharacterized protein n=1 Tax=Trypanosoma congolense (strain IL3000) TaxID=1068625 RepID=G0UP00_TRYCI|nr:hypothetical protein, unlikely [Trypanosoma congolense IL3000]
MIHAPYSRSPCTPTRGSISHVRGNLCCCVVTRPGVDLILCDLPECGSILPRGFRGEGGRHSSGFLWLPQCLQVDRNFRLYRLSVANCRPSAAHRCKLSELDPLTSFFLSLFGVLPSE